MSKFLYPIYKLNIESYKKWWLYHKKAGGSGILSEIIQGFSFNLENTLNRKFKLFEIQGNSVQNGTPSPDNEVPIESAGDNESITEKIVNKNWLPNDATTQTKNGIDFTVYDDGTVKANGTSTGYAIITIANIELPRGNYILNGCPTGGGSSTYLLRTQDGVNISDAYDTGSGANISVTENSGSADIKLQISPNVIINNLIFKPKLERGNKATPYSPYGMGSINEKIGNKNWNTSPLQDGSLTNGLPDTNYETCRTTNFIDIKPSTNYAFSINGILNRVVVSMYDKDKNFIATDGAGGYASSNGLFTTYANAYYIKYRAYNADKQLFLNGKIQLEPGSTATPYVPHEEQDYSIFVQQPMRSIGDVRDCFVQKDGNWFERHYIGRYLFTGNESVNLLSSNDKGYLFQIYKTFPLDNYTTNYRNNYSLANSTSSSSDADIGSYIFNGTYRLRVPSTLASNVEEFKNWLKTANNTIYYPLSEPLDLPCTEEQINVLENLPSTYKDFTIIQSEDETEAYLKIQYWKEV